MRAIDPKKKLSLALLDAENVRYNRKISSDREIIENYFGRVCGLWDVRSSKYRWAETSYDTIFKLCVALTNLHVCCNLLRQADVERHPRIRNRQLPIGNTQIVKRRRAQERHRRKRASKVQIQLRALCFPDREPSPSTRPIKMIGFGVRLFDNYILFKIERKSLYGCSLLSSAAALTALYRVLRTFRACQQGCCRHCMSQPHVHIIDICAIISYLLEGPITDTLIHFLPERHGITLSRNTCFPAFRDGITTCKTPKTWVQPRSSGKLPSAMLPSLHPQGKIHQYHQAHY